MNRQLEMELSAALQGLGNTAVPMTDAQVREMIDEIRALTAKLAARISGSDFALVGPPVPR